MVHLAEEGKPSGLRPEHLQGASNLLHYVALRRHDVRELQQDLAALGFSSLGRTESHVLATIRAVLHLLGELTGEEIPQSGSPDLTVAQGKQLLDRNTDALLGSEPEFRRVRIMVTMPSEAATNYELVRDLAAQGMNCMRINCAHDGPQAWAAMIANLRQAEKECGVKCKVEMDLGGPKLRTGPVAPGPAVVKCHPQRDEFGRVIRAGRIWFTPEEHPGPTPGPANAVLPVPEKWLAHLMPQSHVRLVDSRGARRLLRLVEPVGTGWWAESDKTVYFATGLVLSAHTRHGKAARSRVGVLPPKERSLVLRPGDNLVLTESLKPGQTDPPRIGVTLPEFFDCVKPNDPIWLDDGKIGGMITAVGPKEATVQILQARSDGEKLGAEKGINIPETDLRISSLTREDRQHLAFIAQHADIAGFSFVRSEADVRELRAALEELGRADLPIMLKIETRKGFENLPQILLEAMRGGAVGVMIARGDLAVECGFERLAELQEEILWIAEAAHVPVVWATQVLETLAKTGKPSRSEITDAAMGERAECVMLNKGPYIAEAVRVLDDILRRMEAHQEKKTAMLRKLNVAATFAADTAAV
jgi:pyruvate kinase